MSIINWNDFLVTLKKTIGDDEVKVVLTEGEDFTKIKSVKEIINFKVLYAFLKQHQIEHRRAWIFQFEKSFNEIFKYVASRYNYPHINELEEEVIDNYEYEIEFINEKRDTFTPNDMGYIPNTLKYIVKFYSEYKTRVIDYEANIEYRKAYFDIRKGIEAIPKNSLFIRISCGTGAFIFVDKKHKKVFDELLEKIGFELCCYELDEDEIDERGVEFGYHKLDYYDFNRDASLSEYIYSKGYADYVKERAIINAFEDAGRIIH